MKHLLLALLLLTACSSRHEGVYSEREQVDKKALIEELSGQAFWVNEIRLSDGTVCVLIPGHAISCDFSERKKP